MANRATGKVNRIYSNAKGSFFKLDYDGVKPKDAYFFLSKSHENYNSLYSLAVVAAVNRYNLQIRTKDDIDPAEHAQTVYMVVNW